MRLSKIKIAMLLAMLITVSIVFIALAAPRYEFRPCHTCGGNTKQLVYCSLTKSREQSVGPHTGDCDYYNILYFTECQCTKCNSITWPEDHLQYAAHTNTAHSPNYKCPY